jgi:hypothetical protein
VVFVLDNMALDKFTLDTLPMLSLKNAPFLSSIICGWQNGPFKG